MRACTKEKAQGGFTTPTAEQGLNCKKKLTDTAQNDQARNDADPEAQLVDRIEKALHRTKSALKAVIKIKHARRSLEGGAK